MSQMTAHEAQTTGDQSVVSQAQEKVQERAHEARGAIGRTVRDQVDSRSSQAGDQLREVAEALSQTSQGLRSQGKDAPAKVIDGMTDRAQQVASYLSGSDPDRILRDAEDFARRNPWVVIGGGLFVGLIASRLLKASSSRRFDELQGGAAPPSKQGQRGSLAGPQGYLPDAPGGNV